MYTDAVKLEEALLALSPADAKEIKALCEAIKRYTWLIRATGENPFQWITKAVGTLGSIPLLKKYGSMNMAEYAARFKDPLIRPGLSFRISGFRLYEHLGYPQGSSLALARKIEHTFLDLDGTIAYRKKVTRIVVQEERATGIELTDGTVEQADIVISAADGHTTLFDALRERFAVASLYSPFIQVSLGVNRDMTDTPHAVKVQTAAPFEVAGRMREELSYQHYAFDPTLAPEGNTVLYPSDLAWWEKLGYRSNAYRAEKKKILDITIAQLDQVLPGLASHVEASDMATPFTTFRYTHNWQAALGFMMTKKLSGEMVLNPQYTLPGLDGFYMIGLWVKGFGVPMAAGSGKEVVQEICKADGRKFRAEGGEYEGGVD